MKIIVVTQDYGLATMALSKDATCINQNGLVMENIDISLEHRYFDRELRRKQEHYTKIKKEGTRNRCTV